MGRIKGAFAGTYDRFVMRPTPLPAGLLDLVKPFNAKDILELGCGTGLIAAGLAAEGYSVVGVDYSRDMLRQARRRVRGHNRNIRFVEADISLVNLHRQFDLLLCLGNTLPHFTSHVRLRGFLANCRRHLRPGGHIMIQQLNYDRILKDRPITFATDIAENLIRIKQYRYLQDRIVFHITLIDSAHLPPTVRSTKVLLGPWLKNELASKLGKAGFGDVKAHGGYAREPFSKKSKDLILVAKAI